MSENKPPEKRPAPRTAFKPGKSGNPGGRPKALHEVEAAARKEGVACIETWVEIRDDKKQPAVARIAAAERIMDRGFGKPTQRNEHTGADGGPIQTQQVEDTRMPIDELIAGALAKTSSDKETRH